jgi:hypothetical protein
MSASELNSERGWVLVIAMVVMVLMLGIGLAALSLTDTQNQQSRKEREREAALNLAEGVLYSQSFILALPPSCNSGPCEGWPGTVERVYSGCTQATGGLQCPNDATLANVANTVSAPASFRDVDTQSGTTWSTSIEDNGPANAPTTDYATRQDPANPAADHIWHYDHNGDNKIWVRATAIVRNHTRTVVGLMQIENVPISFPRTVLTAGTFSLQQNGNNTYIDTGGTSVQVRCTPPATPTTNDPCADYDKTDQVSGAPGTVVGGTSSDPVLPDDVRQDLLNKAKSNGGWFPAGTCPTGEDMQKPVIYVVNCNRTYDNSNQPQGVGTQWQCSYTIRNYTPVSNQRCIHGPGRNPFGGTVVWERGTLGFSSGVAFFGVIYHLNLNRCGAPTSDDLTTGPGLCQYDSQSQQSIVVTTAGGGTIVGAINIDGTGGVEAGNNKFNIVYDPAVFNDQSTFGTTGLVQNTWRELDNGGIGQ